MTDRTRTKQAKRASDPRTFPPKPKRGFARSEITAMPYGEFLQRRDEIMAAMAHGMITDDLKAR